MEKTSDSIIIMRHERCLELCEELGLRMELEDTYNVTFEIRDLFKQDNILLSSPDLLFLMGFLEGMKAASKKHVCNCKN